MLELFTNPGYLAAGGALVSAPIIIHLINRMRFKRLRWAAMEFLLKSQKRNRRRRIIEQLLLLMLRCFLVLLTALLVLRFVGFSLAGFVGQDALHVVILDDTLSMKDQWKEGNEPKTCFKVAKYDAVFNGIVKSVSQSSTNERLAILPLSKLATDPNYQPKIYQHLSDAATEKEIKADLDDMAPTNLHVDLVLGVNKAARLIGDHPDKRHVLHLVSDFRQADWSGPEAEGLIKALKQMVEKKVKVRPVDTVYPYRAAGQGGVPISHDNVGIIDLRANTRVVGKGMPVTFTVSVANYSPREENLKVVIFDDTNGKDLPQVDPIFLKVPAGSPGTTATFELRLYPDIKSTDRFYAQKLSARLESTQGTPLENDGLPDDNVRYAAVEIRNKVPILVIDGEGPRGRSENGDSFFLDKAIMSVPGGSYEVVYGDELSGGTAVKALERADLLQYPSIFLLNVRELNAKQLRNLESYVSEGGGVGFFLGPQVSGAFYTKELYRKGKGIFPAPLGDTYYPPANQDPLKSSFTGQYHLLLRDDQFPGTEPIPVFGAVFREPAQRDFLMDLPIRRYFQVPRSEWTVEPGRVFELATLPNEQPISSYQGAAVAIVDKLPVEDPEYQQFWPALKRHVQNIRTLVAPGSEHKTYRLAQALKDMLSDRGDQDRQVKRPEYPNLTEFWSLSHPKVRTLREEAERLREAVLYGDPLVVSRTYGKGRVVAVLSTAGKEWNDWGGGSQASVVYQPFIWEMQNYLSSQGGESNLTLGTPIKLEVDSGRYKQQGIHKLKMVRSYYKAQHGQPVQVLKERPNFGVEDKGLQTFVYDTNYEPGFFLSELYAYDDNDHKNPLAGWGHVFNVDTQREGKLQRLSQEDFDNTGVRQAGETIGILPPLGQADELINRQSDLSESPWFFLWFLAILVAEQALAVHLSFHLKGSEGELPSQVVSPHARAA